MIESVQARHRGAYEFEDHYDNECALQDSAPLSAVKTHLSQGILDLNGDRIRLDDWMPIINTLKINKSLQFVAVRSHYQCPSAEDEQRASILRRKIPAIRSKEITHRLCKALRDSLSVSRSLSCVELQGLALRDRDLGVLVKGISKSQTLQHLSLEYCRIGDQGLEILCKGLKNTKIINSVNLTGCSLSPVGAEYLAQVIKHQGMQRHNEAWRDSLRYRRPDLDSMSGIRRITANNNPMLGDEGSRFLAEVLKDDLWLKALDLQSCGISNVGTRHFLDVLNFNTTLVVLDLRRNPLIDRELIHRVMEDLMLNSQGEESEYKWINTEEREERKAASSGARPTKRRTNKVLNSTKAKKTIIKEEVNRSNSYASPPSVTPSSGRRRNKYSMPTTPKRVDIKPSPGQPWRTAARANRFRGHPPESYSFSDLSGEPVKNNNYENVDESVSETEVIIDPDGDQKRMNRLAQEAAKLEESHLTMDLTNHKEVKIELEQMRRHLREERLCRAKADQKVVQLMLENRRLNEELTSLKKHGPAYSGVMDDEKFLESVESSFKQFHAFIDMLREAGLGQLVTMAGLDQSIMPFGNNSNLNNSSIDQNNFSTTIQDDPPVVLERNYENIPVTTQPEVTASGAPLVSTSALSFPESPEITYTRENNQARQEADELYDRLMRETRGALDGNRQLVDKTLPRAMAQTTDINHTKTEPHRTEDQRETNAHDDFVTTQISIDSQDF